MNKKKIFFISIFITLVVSIFIVFYFKVYVVSKVVSPLVQVQPTHKVEEVEMVSYIDQSEFKISYPKDLKLNTHDEDSLNYSHVEFTSSNHPGGIIFWTKDTTVKNLDDWVIKNKVEGIIDSTLGDLPSKKFIQKGDTPKLFNTIIRNGFLYQIEVNLEDSVYWENIYNKMLLSYEFVNSDKSETPKNTSSNNNSSASETMVDEEEIVE